MVIVGSPGACVSPVPALCCAHSSGGETAFSLGRSRTCSGCLVFSGQDCGHAPVVPGTDASHLAHGCDPDACDHHSA